MKRSFGIIYKITNIITLSAYIGQTKGSLEKRFRRHTLEDGCPYLHNSICKYGKENFEVKILAYCDSKEEMNHRESYYIKLFNTMAPNGYNLIAGGDLYGKGNPFYGKKHTKRSKKKMSKNHRGPIKHSEKTKRKMSAWQKGVKKTNTDAINKMAATLSKRQKDPLIKLEGIKAQKTCKQIICHQNNTVYLSIRHAARELGIRHDHISEVVRGIYKQYRGYTFSYIKEVA